VVYARNVGSKTLTFIVSGRLWRNSLIMQDEETGTYWSHVTGEALAGPLEGERLDVLHGVQTTWAKWKKRHPNTKVLEKQHAVTSSRYAAYFEDPERTGLFRSEWLMKRLPGKAKVVGLTLDDNALAFTVSRLESAGFAQADLDETSVVVASGDDGGMRAFDATATSIVREDETGLLVDRETSSRWNPTTGAFVDGPLEGKTLEEIPTTIAFWFAWSSFYPNTKVVD
jgi:hypothetical protein